MPERNPVIGLGLWRFDKGNKHWPWLLWRSLVILLISELELRRFCLRAYGRTFYRYSAYPSDDDDDGRWRFLRLDEFM